MRFFARWLAPWAYIALTVSACSLPADEQAVVIDPEELPDVLRSDITPTTTTEPGPQTEPVELFVLASVGERSVVVPATRDVELSADFADRLGLLFGSNFTRTASEEALGRSNALREFELLDASINDNRIAIVDIVAVDDEGQALDVEATVLADAVAQIVYTATGLQEGADIAAVRILYAGQSAQIPTLEGDTDAVVTRDDFENYDPDWVPPSTTTLTTTTTTPRATTTVDPTASEESG